MVDLETTGLDAQQHEIIELGIVVFEAEAPFTIIDTLNLKIKPEHPETGSAAAYRVNGYTEEAWKDAVTLKEAITRIWDVNGISKSNFCSYNVTFDWSFMQEAYKKLGEREPFHHLKLDMFSLAWGRIPQGNLNRWNLKSVCEYLGVPPEPEVHRALNGAMAAYNSYARLMGEGFVVTEQTMLSL